LLDLPVSICVAYGIYKVIGPDRTYIALPMHVLVAVAALLAPAVLALPPVNDAPSLPAIDGGYYTNLLQNPDWCSGVPAPLFSIANPVSNWTTTWNTTDNNPPPYNGPFAMQV
jgi:hypothetical protein